MSELRVYRAANDFSVDFLEFSNPITVGDDLSWADKSAGEGNMSKLVMKEKIIRKEHLNVITISHLIMK